MIIIDFLLFATYLSIIILPIGKIILDFLKIRLNFWETILISINLGIVFISIVVYLFGVFKLTKILPFFLLLIPIFFLNLYKIYLESNKKLPKIKIETPIIVVVFVSVVLTGGLNFYSGDILDGKIILMGTPRDSLWHIALINSLNKGIYPENPIFANTYVQNYHYFTDIFISSVAIVTKISVPTLYFKIIGPFLSLLFSATLFVTMKRLTNSKAWSLFSVLLIIFSSNLYYLINLFYPNAYNNPSVLWVEEFSTRLVNLQLLVSYIIILTLLYLILIYKRNLDFKFSVIFAITAASLLGFKTYGFTVFLIAFFILVCIKLIRKKFNYLTTLIAVIFVSILLFSVNIKTNGFPFIYSPLWFIKNMFETTDHLNYNIWELKRQVFLLDKNYLRISLLYLQGLAIFIIGNLGAKVIGLWVFRHKIEEKKRDVILLICLMAFVGFISPMIFIQKGIVWNTIQFCYYSVLFMGLLTVVSLSKITKNHRFVGMILASIVWVTLLPGVFFNLNKYFSVETQLFGSREILLASNFLESRDEGVVLLDPKYTGDAFVPAISNKSVFFADETNLSIQLINFDFRKKENNQFFLTEDYDFKKDFLVKNRVKYIFANCKSLNCIHIKGVEEIYSNTEITVYEIFL